MVPSTGNPPVLTPCPVFCASAVWTALAVIPSGSLLYKHSVTRLCHVLGHRCSSSFRMRAYGVPDSPAHPDCSQPPNKQGECPPRPEGSGTRRGGSWQTRRARAHWALPPPSPPDPLGPVRGRASVTHISVHETTHRRLQSRLREPETGCYIFSFNKHFHRKSI